MTFRTPLERPWLTVAMPVHDGERWFRQTLDSVAGQDCSGIEFIIIDSSADDACGRMVAEYQGNLNIIYERNSDLISWTAKTNLAVERASAEHVSMLHQDDLWLPNRTSAVRKAIGTFADAVMIINPSYIVDDRSRRLGLWRCPLPRSRNLGGAEVAKRLLVQNFVAIPAPVIRRRAWLSARGMDSALWYTADWDLYLKLLSLGSIVYHGPASTSFRVHGSSLTVSGSRDSAGFEAQMRTVVERHIDLAPAAERCAIMRRAEASVTINCALAVASTGGSMSILRAVTALLRLGPSDAARYLRDSRLLERAWPRCRARWAGSF